MNSLVPGSPERSSFETAYGDSAEESPSISSTSSQDPAPQGAGSCFFLGGTFAFRRQDRQASNELKQESHFAMEYLSVLSRIAHVGTAIVLVGGTVFMRFVLMPAAKELPEAEHDQLRQRLLARWKRVVHGGIALLLLSGLYNYMQQIPKHKGDGLYHALLGTKMLLALVVFFIASALVGRSAAFEKMRQNRAKWMGLIVLLSALIVGISGFVKVRGPKPKLAVPAESRQMQNLPTVTSS